MNRKTAAAWALLFLGIAARAVPHPANVTPLVGIALFSGASLPLPMAASIPLAVIILTDWLFYGFHPTIFFTWSAFAMIGLFGLFLKGRVRPAPVAIASLGGSVWFYLWTNFGHWLVAGDYPRTLQGLWACYAAAIPFFRNGLLGDGVYTAALFGIYVLAARQAGSPARVQG